MGRTAAALRVVLGLGGVSIAVLTGTGASARVKAADQSVLAMDRILSPAVQPLYVTSPAAEPGQPIPDVYTAFGKNTSPPITWDGAPPNTLAYAVIMEDSDAGGSTPKLHWVAYNIPGSAKGLGHAIRNAAEPKVFSGMRQGVNAFGGIGYIGPHPDAGDPPHHYHFEVFALDRPLNIKGGVSLDKVIAAMNDRVIAEGEVVGTYAAPPGQPSAQ
jgi:Raf kinase inhibitor-like YbhB/YbcL family protein